MKNNPNHGNRLRSVEDAYNRKKEQSKERYAKNQLAVNPWWHHERVLRDLKNIFDFDVEIPISKFKEKQFEPTMPKHILKDENRLVFCYGNIGIYLLNLKTSKLCQC